MTQEEKHLRHMLHQLTDAEHDDLKSLREARRKRKKPEGFHTPLTLAQKMADRVASLVGSWRFILWQSAIIVLWIFANVWAWNSHWDPYPFILLNLALSFQAAFTAPIIMMSQNRQAEIDRFNAQQDYEVNRKAELEIESLHEKIDLLREKEIAVLTVLVKELSEQVVKLSKTQ